ncbi:SPOR domain-containing protein [Dongia sp. agr-C8]
MSAAEAPKSEQIQANVAAALSRLRGELGAASSPVASPTPIPLPKVGAEPAPAEPMPDPMSEPVALAPLPAGPVRAETGGAVRPFEPILNAMSAGNSNSAPSNDTAPAEGAKPDLFGRLRADPSLTTDRAAAAAMLNASEAKPDSQPDLLTGMEVPPAPPPPLGSFEAEDEVNGRGRRMRNRLMVLAAIVVIAGGAAWAWVSSHRTPEGPVPVITADSSPEKVKPEDEGGMQVPNQNVEILNGQATTDEQPAITPPPEQPVSPPMTESTDEANAASQAPAITDAPKPAEPSASDAVPSVDAPTIPSVAAPEPGQTAAAPAPVVSEAETQQAAPAPAEPTPAPATTAEKPADPAASAPATSTAKAPEPAPAPAPAPKAEPTQTAAAATAPAAPSVAPTAGGTARIQLAAVKSEALAKSEWAKLQKAHPALLGGLTLNVQAVDKNGSKLYRIQAGPLTKAQAKDLCTQLKAQKQDCIVAK